MTKTLERLRRKTREVGPLYLARLALRRLIPARHFGLTRSVLLELRLAPRPQTPVAPAQVRWAGQDEHELLSSFGHAPETLRARMECGDRACVLIREERLAAYAWFHRECYEEPDLGSRFRLRPDEIWLYDAMVAPSLRGRGIYPSFLTGAAELLEQEGFSRILVKVDEINRNSMRAHCAAGAVPIATFQALRLFGFTRVHDGRRADACWCRPGTWYVTDVPRSTP